MLASSKMGRTVMDIEVLFSDDPYADEKHIELQHIETPEPPRLIADDRPAWQTKYGPARRGRR